MYRILSQRAIPVYLIIIIVLLVYFMPVTVPYRIKSTGKVMPAREYILSVGRDGQLISNLMDNRKGVSNQFNAFQFERGDEVSYTINQTITVGEEIRSGDTLAKISSYNTQRLLVSLQGDLRVMEAMLALYQSGEKKEVIEKANAELDYALADADIQDSIFARNKKLYDTQVIPDEEYELQYRETRLRHLQIAINKKQLSALKSGVKEEEIDYILSQIDKIKQDLKIVEEQVKRHILLSPITGIVQHTAPGDTLLIVHDVSGYLVFMPVRFGQKKHLSPGTPVKIHIIHTRRNLNGEFIQTSNTISFIDGQQVLMSMVLLKGSFTDVYPGMVVKCSINCGEITLKEYLKRFLISVLKS
ncbi:MAG: hypothetical protein KAT48_12330 [Bacteroidales bacterium]|nr:hypothetical protein [Bacteroidales bacterium]